MSGEFDSPVFKILANNDTGAASGHQGGMVIPADLDPYFPRLEGTPTPEQPTLDADVTLELWIHDKPYGVVQSRYQFQTWGAGRSLERRLTGGFPEWRNEARGGDVAVFQRSVADERYYRLTLYKQEQVSPEIQDAIQRSSKRWGIVDTGLPPVTNELISKVESEVLADEPASIFEERERIERSAYRIARGHGFRSAVIKAYRGLCCVTGEAIFAPSGHSSSDAAHIVPVEMNGADVVQNGLALRKDLHWAFDRGLWSITDERRIILSPLADQANPILREISGCELAEPENEAWEASINAIEWHRMHRLLR